MSSFSAFNDARNRSLAALTSLQQEGEGGAGGAGGLDETQVLEAQLQAKDDALQLLATEVHNTPPQHCTAV